MLQDGVSGWNSVLESILCVISCLYKSHHLGLHSATLSTTVLGYTGGCSSLICFLASVLHLCLPGLWLMDSSQSLRLFLLPEIIFSSHLLVLSLDKQKRICNYLSIIRFLFIKTRAYGNDSGAKTGYL